MGGLLYRLPLVIGVVCTVLLYVSFPSEVPLVMRAFLAGLTAVLIGTGTVPAAWTLYRRYATWARPR
jgi:hypothetical protein